MEEINAAPIRVEEFAKQVGTTPTNIRNHLKKHAAELEGHIEVLPNRGGTLLDFEAQRIIKSKMRTDTVLVDTARTVELLEENNKLLHQVNELLIQRTELQLAATRHAELQAAHEDLQSQLDEATDTIADLSEQLTVETEAAAELRIEYNKQKNLIFQLTDELEKAAELNATLQAAADAATSEAESLKNRGFWSRLFNK